MVLVWRLEKQCACVSVLRVVGNSHRRRRRRRQQGACRGSKCYYNICRKRTTHGAGKLVAFTRGRVCSSLWYIYTEIYKYCTRGSGTRDLFDYIYTHMNVEFTITRSILALYLPRPLFLSLSLSPFPSTTSPSTTIVRLSLSVIFLSPPSRSGLFDANDK